MSDQQSTAPARSARPQSKGDGEIGGGIPRPFVLRSLFSVLAARPRRGKAVLIARASWPYSVGVPTIFVEDGFRFFFYSADGDEPIHVHVERTGNTAKFWLRPIRLATNHGMRSHELTRARQLLEGKLDLVEEKWNEFFNS